MAEKVTLSEEEAKEAIIFLKSLKATPPRQVPEPSHSEKYCLNCLHWKNNHCAIYSCSCATAIFNRTTPTYFTQRDEEE